MFNDVNSAFKDMPGLGYSSEEILKKYAEAEEKLQEAIKQAEFAKQEADEAIHKADIATKLAEQKTLEVASPKDKATANNEPWVGVIDTHVNKDNIRNGFFELDWNDQFIQQLKENGYGENGDSDESIIDRWFRELCANVIMADGYDSDVITGSLDIASVKRDNL